MAPVINPEESPEAYRRRLDGVAYSTYILIMLVVPLKLWCRKRSGGWRNIQWDDYISIFALLVANGFLYVCMIGMRQSLGIHVTQLTNPMQDVIDFLRYVFIANILYTLCITSIKLSILAFYWRLFSVKGRTTIYIVTAMVLAWGIAILCCVIFSCLPIRAAWDITLAETATCIQTRDIYLGGSVPNVFLDLVVVMMPIPHVMRLHAPLAQRFVLGGMFALGTFIAVVSLVRLIIFLQIPLATQGDATYNFREVIVWSIVEVNIGLTCACLPSLKPVFSILGMNRIFSRNGSRPSDMKSPGPDSSLQMHGQSGASKASRPRKRGATGGMFSTLAGVSRIEDEEDDEFKMMEGNARGKNNIEIELHRVSDDDSQRRVGELNGISVQKNWSVFAEERTGKAY